MLIVCTSYFSFLDDSFVPAGDETSSSPIATTYSTHDDKTVVEPHVDADAVDDQVCSCLKITATRIWNCHRADIA